MPANQSVFANNLMYLTDGGLETTLIFHEQCELPCFASFILLETPQGREQLYKYYREYLELYQGRECGFVLETPTWRANRDWARKLGYDEEQTDRFNIEAVGIFRELAKEYEKPGFPILISGNIGPRGDGYVSGKIMSVREAEEYHSDQIKAFKRAGADLVTAVTINYPQEAIGIINAAVKQDIPVVIAFTVETDGRLPSGMSLQEAIEETDKVTHGACLHFMVNCAHPSHYLQPVIRGGAWLDRIGGVRSNASVLSHAELDEAEVLDEGNPQEFALLHQVFAQRLPNLKVFGGCCGTDCRHVQALAETFLY
ncbi:homocysteine S-methyltransferase family protein [Bowmanella dokdonensis]|uniref:Homocysteine S-methyltransferase family protein n=1 Tax=Bowmanella dokdonensis TaxID=751969 RepID=A0A939DMV8_9ALTE|nr:homocysteine S-methyltransferase family protein [Bowmanella dokdonensis]MBN7825413.1 homocysteine S-methyltransferase family protein [Bowmanella dokdonensis]